MATNPITIRSLLAAALLGLLAPAAFAVVHTTGDGLGNAGPPPNDPGFANVGSSANFKTGVYLGDRWVLTAHHVGQPDFQFAGLTYPTIAGSRIQLETEPGVGADLALVRLGSAPPLPELTLASVRPDVGDEVLMIGNGWGREPDITCWTIGAFSEVTCPPGAGSTVHRGYKRLSGQVAVRWGSNVVEVVDVESDLEGRVTHGFETDFDSSGVTDEAQGVLGDSGGAVFLERGGSWELVGIVFAKSEFLNQPAATAIFGNASRIADVAFYSDQIEPIVHPVIVSVPALPPWSVAVHALAVLVLASRLPRHTR